MIAPALCVCVNTFVYMYLPVCICVYVSVCMYLCICVHVFCLSMSVYICVSVGLYLCVCLCTCLCMQVYVCIHHLHGLCLRKPEEGMGSPRTGVTDGHWQPYGYCQSDLGPLEDIQSSSPLSLPPTQEIVGIFHVYFKSHTSRVKVSNVVGGLDMAWVMEDVLRSGQSSILLTPWASRLRARQAKACRKGESSGPQVGTTLQKPCWDLRAG